MISLASGATRTNTRFSDYSDRRTLFGLFKLFARFSYDSLIELNFLFHVLSNVKNIYPSNLVNYLLALRDTDLSRLQDDGDDTAYQT